MMRKSVWKINGIPKRQKYIFVKKISEIGLDNRNFSFLADSIKIDIINTIEYCAVSADIAKILDIIVGRENEFFHSDEMRYAMTIKSAKVRHGFYAGRYCIKYLFLTQQSLPFSFPSVNVISRNSSGQGIRPFLSVNGKVADCGISITHSDMAVFVMLTKSGINPGCDIVPLGSITKKVCKHLFNAKEQALCKLDSYNADKIWAIKETSYKAGNKGQAFSPKHWHVEQKNDDWECSSSIPEIGDVFFVQTFLHENHAIAVTVKSVKSSS